jgi:tartrate dehydratase beta subunit/fumarate hydratase class I family protein
MEAVSETEVVDFPALILVGDKGNDLYAQLPMIS